MIAAKTPEEAVQALADAIRRQDIGEAADTATPAAWGRDVQTLYQMARTRGQTLALAAAAVIDGERATVRCGLDQPRRPTARVTLMVTRDETGGWKVAGVASERAVSEAWRRGWIAAGMQYRDLPASALGVAIAERIIATVASGGELAAALDDDSAGGLIAYPVLAKTLSGERKRVTALPAREHPTLGRLAVGFEIVDLATLGSDEIWLVLEDRGDGAKALATVSFMSLAMVLDDHGGGLPTPVSGRSEVPGAWRAPVLGDAFERAVLSAASATRAAAGTAAEGDLFERAVGAALGDEAETPWERLAAELRRSLDAAADGAAAERDAGQAEIGRAPLVTSDELVERVRTALGSYLEPFARAGVPAIDAELVGEHLQGLVGAAFQAIVPLLEEAIGERAASRTHAEHPPER